MISVDLDKVKTVAHQFRRRFRDAEFEPFDDIISRQIPGPASAEAEASRQQIREKYSVIQQNIDAATSYEEVKTIIGL